MANKKISELTKVSNLEKTALFITETSAGTRAVSFEDLLSKIKEIFLDTNKPSGAIRIGSKAYTTWKDTVSFDTYYNENQSVTIEASDNESGVKEIAYYIATTGLDNADLEAVEWTTYSGAFTIQPNNNYIVYAKITDNANNVTYICSDGIVLDNISPVFTGMEDGGTYPVGTVLTLNDGETLTVNGTAVELTDNSYTFTEAMDNIQLSITDRAGNINTISVTLFQCYVPANAYENWRYTLDDANKTITLERYIGSEEDVTVYKNYLVNGKLYDTRIGNGYDYAYNYMFGGNNVVKNIIFDENINTNEVTRINGMFYMCTNLESLSINGFDTSNVIDMNQMFYGCRSLTELNINNFDTNNVTNMGGLFYGCTSLKELNFSNLNTSNVTDMRYMFYGCRNITILNLSHFNTSNVSNMNSMFRYCVSLINVDLSSFNTGNVNTMYRMFEYCSKLKELDLINFDTNNVNDISFMFHECRNLSKINVSNGMWNIINAVKDDMFTNCGTSSVTYI